MASRDDIIAHHGAGTLPQLFVERVRGHRNDEVGRAFRAELVAIHNEGVIDVLEPARSIASSPIGQHDFFLVQSAYVEIIPELDAEVPAMLSAVRALVARAGNDGMAGRPNGAFRKWAETGDRAVATLAHIDAADGNDATYVFLALQALGAKHAEIALDRSIDFLTGEAVPARSGAAKAIGTLPLSDAHLSRRAMDALHAACAAAPDDNLMGHLIGAAVELASKAPELENSAVDLIGVAEKDVGDIAIHHASSTLAFHAGDLSAAIVAALTRIAHKVRIESSGTLDQLDHAAWALLNAKRLNEALALLTPIISHHAELASLEKFNSFSSTLLELGGDQLASVVTGWLLSLDPNLGEAARGLVGDHHGDDPLVFEFNSAALRLSEAETLLLAHRAIGYLFVYPITAASIVMCLIRGASPEPSKAMAEILFDPLLINFSGELADWLKKKAADDSESPRPIIETLLSRLDTYIDGLRRVGRIKELRPSERERLIENHRQHESMRQVHKGAEKKSALMSLVSRSVLLYGQRSISYFEGPDGRLQRNEIKLHSFSHSIETPRLDILEPFDLDYTLRVFRAMRVAK